MPLHHYLPATFLAEFSRETGKFPRRRRKLYVGNKVGKSVFCSAASKVAAVNNLYTLVGGKTDPDLVDDTWSDYEQDLNEAIDLLITGRIDARSWIRILVPFVAAMFVRGPDFNLRFERRLRALGLESGVNTISEDNTNGARLLELQRLLGPVAVAKWTVVHVIGTEPLITNDLGYAPYKLPLINEIGISVPLGPTYTLNISPRTQGEILRIQNDEWAPVIDYTHNMPNNHEDLNMALTSIAQQFVFGPDKETINKYISLEHNIPFPIEPEQLGFITDPLARAHEFTWHRLAAEIEKNPDGDNPSEFDLDWEHIAKGWSPPVFFPLNLIEFPPALRREGDAISADFYDPEVYYSLSRIRHYEQMEEFDALLDEAEKGLEIAEEIEHKIRFMVAKGSALDEKGQHQDALELYDSALKLDPQSSTVVLNKGVSLLNSGDVDGALKCFDESLSLDPEFDLARVNRGGLLTILGKFDLALEDLSDALKSIPPGPAHASALLSRGKSHIGLRSYSDAIIDLDAAYDEYKDSLPQSYCLYHKAIAQRDFGDQESALETVNKAIELNPVALDFFMLRAELQIKIGDLDGAIKSAMDALSLDLSDEEASEVHDFISGVLTMKDDIKGALLENQLAMDLDPHNLELIFNRGLSLLRIGEIHEAVNSFSKVIELDDKNSGTWNNRGIARAAMGDYSGAISDHLQCIQICNQGPDNSSALRHLAKCHLLLGDIESSKKYLKEAKESDPDSPFIDFVEGLILIYCGEFSRAFSIINASADKLELLPDIRIYLSLPTMLMGEVTKGIGLVKSELSKLKFQLTKHELLNHVRALTGMFPERNCLYTCIDLLDDNKFENLYD